MRVLLVNKFHYRKGGAETYYFTIGHELERMGHDVAYFSMKHPQNVPCAQEKFFVTQREYNNVKNPYTAARDGMALIYSREAKRNFQALCEEFKPDVVHLNNVHRQITLSILDAPYLKEHRVPVVYTAHDHVTVCPAYLMMDGEGNVCDRCVEDGHYRHCIEHRCVKGSRAKSALAVAEASFYRRHGSYEKIDAVIAPSEYMKSKLVEGGWPITKVIARKNFASGEILERAKDTAGSKQEQVSPYFLFFGRISKEKGIDVLVEAFKAISSRIPDWRLIVAGDGPEKLALEQGVLSSGYAGKILFVGYQKGEALQRLITCAAFAVSGSRCRENMPYSVIEAFASGTPSIGSRIGGIPELIEDGVTGYLCDPGSSSSMQAVLLAAADVFKSQDDYRSMQQRCRGFVIDNCDQGEYMNALIALYERLIYG
ncbi:MAG: glycosyltransferase family 4 protein [Coriobacteriaceae bacterium]|nr:glycosyltransferase family 4 protein [Coriobacteriaceae bacterium]